jgi:hypothetical protein
VEAPLEPHLLTTLLQKAPLSVCCALQALIVLVAQSYLAQLAHTVLKAQLPLRRVGMEPIAIRQMFPQCNGALQAITALMEAHREAHLSTSTILVRSSVVLFIHVEMAFSAWEIQLVHTTNLAQQTPTRSQVRPPVDLVLLEAIVLLVQATYSHAPWDGFV